MKKALSRNQAVLYLFNLKADLDDPILSFSLEWIEEFAKHFEEVKVFTTHKGRIEVNPNVTVVELGGGSNWNRVKAILRMYQVLFKILSEPKKPIVFHHMSVHSVALIGLPLRIARVRQGMWYSHSAKNLELRFASRCVTKIFSSSQAAFPLKSKKAHFIGHGIKTSDFSQNNLRTEENDKKVVSVGRITPIKSLEKIIEAIHACSLTDKKVTFIGPTDDKDFAYRQKLNAIGKNLNVEIEFKESVLRKSLPGLLQKYGIFYTGTPGSTDKAAIEAAIAGCYVLTDNLETQRLLGMTDFWKSNQINSPNLKKQLEFIANRPHELIAEDRKKISLIAAKNNDLTNVVERILAALTA